MYRDKRVSRLSTPVRVSVYRGFLDIRRNAIPPRPRDTSRLAQCEGENRKCSERGRGDYVEAIVVTTTLELAFFPDFTFFFFLVPIQCQGSEPHATLGNANISVAPSTARERKGLGRKRGNSPQRARPKPDEKGSAGRTAGTRRCRYCWAVRDFPQRRWRSRDTLVGIFLHTCSRFSPSYILGAFPLAAALLGVTPLSMLPSPLFYRAQRRQRRSEPVCRFSCLGSTTPEYSFFFSILFKYAHIFRNDARTTFHRKAPAALRYFPGAQPRESPFQSNGPAASSSWNEYVSFNDVLWFSGTSVPGGRLGEERE